MKNSFNMIADGGDTTMIENIGIETIIDAEPKGGPQGGSRVIVPTVRLPGKTSNGLSL